MDHSGLALVVLSGGSLWVQETLEGLEVLPVREIGPLSQFQYGAWDTYADEVVALDFFVEWNGELEWLGDLVEGSGITPLLRSKEALRKHERHFATWNGICTECKRLIHRSYRCVYIGGGEWECPRCGYISYHADAPVLPEGRRTGSVLRNLVQDGLPKYRAHVAECARQYEEAI